MWVNFHNFAFLWQVVENWLRWNGLLKYCLGCLIYTKLLIRENFSIWNYIKYFCPKIFQQKTTLPLREKCPYLEFFWSVFSHIRTRNMDEISVNTDAVSVNQFWVNLSIYINTLNWILCHECKNLENEKIENWTKETMFSRLALGFYYAIFEGMHRISIFFWKFFLYSEIWIEDESSILKQGTSWNQLGRHGIICNEMEPATNWQKT